MSRAELRAHEIYSSMQLESIDDEVKRYLMILLLSTPKQKKPREPWTVKYAGAWQGDESAEEIIESIREARTSNKEICL